MIRYIQRRLLIMIPVLWGLMTLIFFLMYMLPGDPASTILAEAGGKAEEIEALREQMGLNDPLPVQYVRFFANAIRGDFGDSIFLNRPVLDIVKENIPPSFELALGGLAVALGLGVTFGTLAALNHNVRKKTSNHSSPSCGPPCSAQQCGKLAR